MKDNNVIEIKGVEEEKKEGLVKKAWNSTKIWWKKNGKYVMFAAGVITGAGAAVATVQKLGERKNDKCDDDYAETDDPDAIDVDYAEVTEEVPAEVE